jgi:phosphoserine phosphatase RsbU/P
VMIVGSGDRERLAPDVLNAYLAVAGLAGSALERLHSQRELERHRDKLEELVDERTRQLASVNEELRELLERLQSALLDIPLGLPGVRFAHLYRSATQEARVGGDFYDVFRAKKGRIALLIGDVCGHGVDAARVATLVKDTVHAFAYQFGRPHIVLRETNRLLVEKHLGGFVTVFIGLLDPLTGNIEYSTAGHPPPLLAEDGEAGFLESAGPPLGVFPNATYRDRTAMIRGGSLLLLYTDGITEVHRGKELFGEERLARALVRLSEDRIDLVPTSLLQEALDFSDGRLADDVALLAVRYVGHVPGSESGQTERAGDSD